MPGLSGVATARRRVGGDRARPASPPGPQQLQFLPAPLGQPALGPAAGGQEADRPTARRPARSSPRPAATPAGRPRPHDPRPGADALPPLSSPAARPGRPRRPRTDLASGRRVAAPARADHRVPGPGPHLPLLRRGHPRRHPRRGPGLEHRPTPGGRPGLSDRPLPPEQAGRRGGRRGGLRRPRGPGHGQPSGASGRRLPGGGPRRGRRGGAPGRGQARR